MHEKCFIHSSFFFVERQKLLFKWQTKNTGHVHTCVFNKPNRFHRTHFTVHHSLHTMYEDEDKQSELSITYRFCTCTPIFWTCYRPWSIPIIGGGGSIGVVVFNAKPYTIKASDGKLLSFVILAGVFISLPNEKQWKKLHRMTKKNKHKVQEKGAHYSQSKKILQKKKHSWKTFRRGWSITLCHHHRSRRQNNRHSIYTHKKHVKMEKAANVQCESIEANQ